MTSNIEIHTPGSSHPTLAVGSGGFDRKWFMGRWGVSWSTLPMWKDKKDVIIEYTPLGDSSNITQFQSVVSYHTRTASGGSKPSTVKGAELLAPGTNGATFDWKGAGWLFFVHSHWEVLGYGKDASTGLEWVVTFFSKTVFTPAGIDIYTRSAGSTTPDEAARQFVINNIASAIQQSGDKVVRDLAAGGFNVPGSA